jgi:hypothetical protein
MGDRYQVTGECAHVVVTDHTGVSAVNLLYKGAFLPDGVDEKRLKHLLDTGLVGKVDGEPLAPNAAISAQAAGLDTGNSDSGKGDGSTDTVHPPVLTPEQEEAQRKVLTESAETQRKRDAAKAKLPADGSAPHHNAAQEVWVEYAVAKGLDRGEAEKASKDDLKAALSGK